MSVYARRPSALACPSAVGIEQAKTKKRASRTGKTADARKTSFVHHTVVVDVAFGCHKLKQIKLLDIEGISY